MTVLVWDGKTLAADKQVTTNGKRLKVTKIFKVNGNLVGFTGDYANVCEMLKWIEEGMLEDTFPFAPGDNSSSGLSTLVITPKKDILVYQDSPFPMLFSENEYYCDGCGEGIAYGALLSGKTAKEAVEIVCQIDIGCGMGIDTLTLDDPEPKKTKKKKVSK